MRKTKFRGFSVEDNQWVYGDLLSNETGCYIIEEFELDASYGETDLFGVMWHKVYEDSVGQFTGLKDSCDGEIYEGDIYYNDIDDANGLVEWSDEDGMYLLVIENIIYNFDEANSEYGYVVGNFFQNKYLVR